MKNFLLPLMGIMLCASTLHSAFPDPTVPSQTEPGEKLHAAVTDIPDIIDMSHADPTTWHGLSPGAPVHDHVLTQEYRFASRVSGRTRPF
jgi:hypothetical protein